MWFETKSPAWNFQCNIKKAKELLKASTMAIHRKQNTSILHPKGEASKTDAFSMTALLVPAWPGVVPKGRKEERRNEDGLGDKLRLLHIKPYKIRLYTNQHPTKEALYSSGSLSFHALDLRVLFKVQHKTELSYSEAIHGNEICECMRSQLAGLLNLMVASETVIWESCGLSAPVW
ncbi:hypothetical protein CDAR_478591 [Caerostris darwini]|uniref:Uncharacterized protein n=1 Tax=Caerostris darwini TaxID=1538125 RepID=A0AAV4QQJ5_9ARAC|nr:hypothetical protein CDAR_478591 [Caerostris darwini]